MPARHRSKSALPEKRAVVEAIVLQLARDWQSLIASAKAAHAEATHEQNKPENKYDTRALEASYLAHGQSRQIAELEIARQEFEALVVSEDVSRGPVDLGSLLALEDSPGSESWYFVGPKAGGTEVTVGAIAVTVITLQSPLGRLVAGRSQDEIIQLRGRPQRIAAVR